MKFGTVEMPASILLAPALSPTAKLIWIYVRIETQMRPGQGPASMVHHQAPSPLLQRTLVKGGARFTGSTAPTVRRALRTLASAGLLSGPSRPGPSASLPADLLLDTRVGIWEKLSYGILQLTPGFHHPDGQFTFPSLSSLAGISVNTLKRAARVLQETGWLKVARGKKFAPIHFTLQTLAADQRAQRKAAMSRRVADGKPHGEAVMKEYLTLLIDSDEYEENARPGFLVNPYTDEKMELDRYYPPKAAFEFQGEQHDGPTAKFPSETKARKQQARDAIKMDICTRRGVTLIILRRRDLTLATIREKVNGVLPLKDLDPSDPVVAHLEQLSLAYRTNS
ncbi:MAG: hypothetical protein JWN15_4409 [Firmicutes bacterium]|nr:hypothetical protein [Bacillota bacterium]